MSATYVDEQMWLYCKQDCKRQDVCVCGEVMTSFKKFKPRFTIRKVKLKGKTTTSRYYELHCRDREE